VGDDMMPSGDAVASQRGIGDGIRGHWSQKNTDDGAADDSLRGWRCADSRHDSLIRLYHPVGRTGADPVRAAVWR